MLLRITGFGDLDPRRLMDVYAESNRENAEDFFPELTDRDEAVRRVEEGFLAFLRDEFFAGPGAVCWVLAEDGVWVSAARTTRVGPDRHYLEALETRPDRRRRGCGAELLRGIIGALKEEGDFRLCCCVSKRNTASLRTHEKCGFRIVSEEGYDWLLGEADGRDYGLEYAYCEGGRA